MSPIEYQAAKVLGVIHTKPHDYQDALELPRNEQARYGDLMSYVGMYVQGVLLIKEGCAKHMEHKYKYTLNGKIYFVTLTDEEKRMFENRYGVYLEKWQFEVDHMMINLVPCI